MSAGEHWSTYWAAAREGADEELMPLAVRMGLAKPGDQFESFVPALRRYKEGDPRVEVLQMLTLLVRAWSMGALVARTRDRLHDVLFDESCGINRAAAMELIDEQIADEHFTVLERFEELRSRCFGSLSTLSAMTSFRVRIGANARREIGEQTRQRVRAAASAYQHLSRERAAAEIADKVGKSPATVRRMLSEIFPGDTWNTSDDSSRQIGGSGTR